MNQRLQCEKEMIKLVEENWEKNLESSWVRQTCYSYNNKSVSCAREKKNDPDFSKFKTFALLMTYLRKWKDKPQIEKIFTKHTSDQVLVSEYS